MACSDRTYGLFTLHETGTGQGTTGTGQGTENDGFLYYTMYCTHYTGMGQGQQTIVFYCVHPTPCPVPGPVQCV